MIAGIGPGRLRGIARGAEPALTDWLSRVQEPHAVRARAAAVEVAARLDALCARMLVLGEPGYPPKLLDLRDPPALLFVRGTFPVDDGTAVVGTRTPSDAGVAMANVLAQRVAPPVVAGLALGIDAAAHRAALERGVPTIAYVGHGLGATYPVEHRDLEEAIVRHGGAVVSERLPGALVTGWALVRRDRLQAAHAATCVLVESELAGGAMHTMRFAAALGRMRFALEPRAGDARTAGNARAIAAGAQPLAWEV